MKRAGSNRLMVAARWMLGLTFIWAAVTKLTDLAAFAEGVRAYRLPFPGWMLASGAFALPWVELAVGTLLVIGWWVGPALIGVEGLLVLFLLVTGQALVRGLPISCSCFDLAIFSMPDPATNLVKLFDSIEFAFARDLVLAVLTAIIMARHRQLSKVPPVGQRSDLPRLL